MEFTRVKIVTSVPDDYADAIRQALGEAGAGEVGEDTFVAIRYLAKEDLSPRKMQDHTSVR